jgi:Na+/citrate or Na+/malate symporter
MKTEEFIDITKKKYNFKESVKMMGICFFIAFTLYTFAFLLFDDFGFLYQNFFIIKISLICSLMGLTSLFGYEK